MFTPVKLGAIELKNRLVMAPLTRMRAIDGDVPNPLAKTYYEQRASAGLIISEATGISREGSGWPSAPGIWTDEQVEGWRPVTEAVHNAGGRIIARDKRTTNDQQTSGEDARGAADAAQPASWWDGENFDAILLDAPCSATGTFRRNPDVLWAVRPGDIAALASVQARMLDQAALKVRPGGQLVYCVCSLEPEEGEAQIAAFLARRSDFAILPVQPEEGGAPALSIRADGSLRLLPHHRQGGMDGFFAARLIRSAD